MDYLYYLFVVLCFLAVVLFIEGFFLVWDSYKGPEASKIEKRLRLLSAGGDMSREESIIKHRLLAKSPALEKILLLIPRIHSVDRLILQSGLNISVAIFLGLTLAGLIVGIVIGMVLGWPLYAAIVIGIVLAALPYMHVLRAKRKRMNLFDQQLPDALDLMARAMLAGHAFPSALKMVGDECPEPVASEFRVVFDEINYGISVQDALVNMTNRVPSTDLRYFVISVLVQRDTGGNLAELLGNISRLIRERQKLVGTVRVLSAEGRLSAWILGCLPFVLAFIINWINSKFMRVLWTDPAGRIFVGASLAVMILGIIWMRRIIKIRV